VRRAARLFDPLRRALSGAARLLMLRRAHAPDFALRPELFASLVVLDLLLTFVFSVVAFGVRGQLNTYELARALTFVPLVLAVGMLAWRVDRESGLLRLPVAFAAASVLMTIITSTLYVLAEYQLLPFVETYWFVFDDFVLVWSATVILFAVMRLVGGSFSARLWLGLTAIAALVLPALWLPQGMLWMPRQDESAYRASFYTLAEEQAFYAQQGALERELAGVQPQRPGVPDIYVLAAGLYAGEDVFMKDVQLVTGVLKDRLDATGRTVTLVNNPKTLEQHPIASLTSIKEALSRLGEIMDDDEDLLVLYLSSHGSDQHELAVDFRPLRLTPINPERLKAALDESGIRWKVIVISACYSGGFIDALKDERTLIITAASADRTSFGCGSESESTYLARALFGEALKKTRSLEGAFGEARGLIERWEREKGAAPSQPQIYVGSAVRGKLEQIERRLSAQTAHRR
jgi:hypothetical protein